MTLLNCIGGASGGGAGVGYAPWKMISADYVVTVADIAAGALDLKVDATDANVTVTVAPGLGTNGATPLISIFKIDSSAHAVNISDGAEIVDQITTPAGAAGQIGGWRNVRADGVGLVVNGVG